MKRIFCLLIIVLLISCNEQTSSSHDSISDDTTPVAQKSDTSAIAEARTNSPGKPSVLVLPPYDEIANAGISPEVQKYLEQQVAADTNFALVKFSFNQFMGVAYNNVYDKKYCQPIIDKRKTDVIVMTKINLVKPAGKMNEDEWDVSIRIYNTNTGKQTDSKIRIDNVSGENMQRALAEKQGQLRTEILLTQ